MVLKIDDWFFQVDLEKTKEHSSFVSSQHCTCGFCENYYRTILSVCPGLKDFLMQFNQLVDAPSEMYPIDPAWYLSGYRVFGQVLQFGLAPMMVDDVPITAEPVDDTNFLLEVGELELPWVMDEPWEDVISPANEPEFLENMYRKLSRRNPDTGIFCS